MLTRAEFPLYPAAEWFAQIPDWFTPGDKLTFQTEGPDAGRVAATVAPRDQCLIDGTTNCWTAPYSPTAYAAAHQGDTLTADGTIVHTANIGGGVNHARVSATFRDAAKHYDNTATQVMRVRYHDLDSHIIALGALWPDVTDQQLAIVRASGVSGDWRYRRELGAFDMAGAQLVSNPGFPLIRKYAASLAVETISGEEYVRELVYIGGLGGVVEDEPCPSCGHVPDALEERVADLETVVASLQRS